MLIGSYAEILRQTMRAKDLDRRKLKRLMKYSYEHIRKVTSGLPLMSEGFNEDVCRILDLDPQEMWSIALIEKRAAKGKTAFDPGMSPRFSHTWGLLTPQEQDRLTVFAETLLRRRQRVKPDSQLTPEEIVERIRTLASQLAVKP